MKLCSHTFCIDDIVFHILFSSQEEVKEGESTLSVHGHSIKVTEVLKDGDTLTFLILSQKVRNQLIPLIFIHFKGC